MKHKNIKSLTLNQKLTCLDATIAHLKEQVTWVRPKVPAIGSWAVSCIHCFNKQEK